MGKLWVTVYPACYQMHQNAQSAFKTVRTASNDAGRSRSVKLSDPVATAARLFVSYGTGSDCIGSNQIREKRTAECSKL